MKQSEVDLIEAALKNSFPDANVKKTPHVVVATLSETLDGGRLNHVVNLTKTTDSQYEIYRSGPGLSIRFKAKVKEVEEAVV